MSSLQLKTPGTQSCPDTCPFGDAETNICSASLSSMIIAQRDRQEYCSNENYDNCPVFLAKILRRR